MGNGALIALKKSDFFEMEMDLPQKWKRVRHNLYRKASNSLHCLTGLRGVDKGFKDLGI